MAVPKELLREAFALLSAKTLRKAAEHNDIRNRKKMSPAQLANKLGSDDGTNLMSSSWAMPAAELGEVAKYFGIVPLPKKDTELRQAIFEFILNYDDRQKQAKAAKKADTLPAMTLEELQAEAAKSKCSVLLLNPKKVGAPVAVWSADHQRFTKDKRYAGGKRPWISIDMGRHPDKMLRCKGVLEVLVD